MGIETLKRISLKLKPSALGQSYIDATVYGLYMLQRGEGQGRAHLFIYLFAVKRTLRSQYTNIRNPEHKLHLYIRFVLDSCNASTSVLFPFSF